MMRLFLLTLTLALTACGDDEGSSGASQSNANRPNNNNNNGNAGPDNAAPQANNAPEKAKEEEEAFVYRSDGVRDPFAPFIVNVTDDDPKERCALCVPLANLTFTGVVTGIASPVALVETREGVGYFVRRGSELGSNGGRVIDIREGIILLRERFQDQLGRISVVDRSLRIRSEDPMASKPSEDELIETSDPRPANDNSAPSEEERVKKTSGPADEL